MVVDNLFAQIKFKAGEAILADIIGAKKTWYPRSIDSWNSFLSKQIFQGLGYRNVYALRKNIAYNLQYLEYIINCNKNLALTEVIKKQNYKIFILVGCGIVESLLYFLFKIKKLHKQTNYEPEKKYWSNPTKGNDGILRKIETIVHIKLNSPKNCEMNFDAMIKKVTDKKMFGHDQQFYSDLKSLRHKRNKIHLHLTDHSLDTDYNNFNYTEYKKMASVIKTMFEKVFNPNSQEMIYLKFLDI